MIWTVLLGWSPCPMPQLTRDGPVTDPGPFEASTSAIKSSFPLVSRAPSVPDPPLPLTPTYPVPCLEKSSRSFIMIGRSTYRHMNRRFHNDAFLGRPQADQVGRRVQKARASSVHCGSMQDLKLRKQSCASNLLLDLRRISFKSKALFNRYLSSFCRISFLQITLSGFY